MNARRNIIYILLVAIWALTVAWQWGEHVRVRNGARSALVTRAQDFSLALGVVIRSQGRFGIVPQEKIDAVLDELAKSTEVESVVLLNAAGSVTAAAGAPIHGDITPLLDAREHWARATATFVNLVALGPNTGVDSGDDAHPMIVAPPGGPGGVSQPPEGRFRFHGPIWEEVLTEEQRQELHAMMTGKPLAGEDVDRIIELLRSDASTPGRDETIRRTLHGRPLDEETLGAAMFLAFDPAGWEPPPEDEAPRRPPWLSESEFERIQDERGIHWFLVTMSTASLRMEAFRDLRLRGLIAAVSFLACFAVGFAWRGFHRSADLELRLVRAEEMTNHLRELNMAAAGLVHETKNPLNLIRGLAQMISRETSEADSTQETAMRITEEADRVAGRLNQFLDYSRPVEPRLAPVRIRGLMGRLFDILAPDTEDKAVAFRMTGPDLVVEADEDKLRQLLFNLLINAAESVPRSGEIEVRVTERANGSAAIEVRDNGPGVPPESEADIFRPYFTTSAHGTGLGLTVVRQIALAHQWDVEYIRESGAGAVFRVSGLIKLADEAHDHAE